MYYGCQYFFIFLFSQTEILQEKFFLLLVTIVQIWPPFLLNSPIYVLRSSIYFERNFIKSFRFCLSFQSQSFLDTSQFLNSCLLVESSVFFKSVYLLPSSVMSVITLVFCLLASRSSLFFSCSYCFICSIYDK